MIVVGLTGGIASGKSCVIEYLKKKKIPTHDADEIVKAIYQKPSIEFIFFLKTNGFKNTVSNKKINKKIIREEIFKDKKKKNTLEKYLHKEVKKSREIFLKKYKNKEIVFLDIPLLFENKLANICKYVCSTIASLKIRRKRALQRPEMKKKLLDKIIKTQVNDTLRRKKSNYLIDTSKTKIKTYLQVDNIIYDILKK